MSAGSIGVVPWILWWVLALPDGGLPDAGPPDGGPPPPPIPDADAAVIERLHLLEELEMLQDLDLLMDEDP